MKKLFVAILLVALCGGCDDNAVCVIEYMDGEIEEVACFDAWVDRPLFGAPSTLEIIVAEGPDQQKSLATIKRWKLVKKGRQ